jgi:hypothetical protein
MGNLMEKHELPKGVLVPTVFVDSGKNFNWDHDRTPEARNSQFSLTMPKVTPSGAYQFYAPESPPKI